VPGLAAAIVRSTSPTPAAKSPAIERRGTTSRGRQVSVPEAQLGAAPDQIRAVGPEPSDRTAGWGAVVIGATLEGALFEAVRAAVRKARATGTWPD
jgi:hypothetical protein